MLAVVIHELRGAPPVPGSGAAGGHFRSGIAIVERKGAAGDFQPNAVAGGEKAGRGLEIELPEMNLVRPYIPIPRKASSSARCRCR